MASAKDIVSSIISAANRKIQRRRKCQDETDNESHEVDKVRFVISRVRNTIVVDSSVRTYVRTCRSVSIYLLKCTKAYCESVTIATSSRFVCVFS